MLNGVALFWSKIMIVRFVCFWFRKDKGDAQKLEAQVEEARALLAEYNSRLANELDERKRVARMLRDFIHAQKEALTESENRLQVS